MMWTLHLVG